MPIVLEKEIVSSVSVCVWHISETEDFFWEYLKLSDADASIIRQHKLSSRRLEKLACRAALAHLLKTPHVNVSYDQQGMPSIAGFHISFSHSKKAVAVAISSQHRLGIDIEPVKDTILSLYSKFLNEMECQHFDVTDRRLLHFCWGAKESIYKYCGGNVSDYVNHIVVDTYSEKCGKGRLWMDKQWEKIDLVTLEWEQYLIVLAYNPQNKIVIT